MKRLDTPTFEALRDCGRKVLELYGNTGDHTCGVFNLPSTIDRGNLRVIASAGLGWDHVSVSRVNRCPNWLEMEQVKRLFFRDDETAMQLHVPPSAHLNAHPFCLHIWRPNDGREIPTPPAFTVAPDIAHLDRYVAHLDGASA